MYSFPVPFIAVVSKHCSGEQTFIIVVEGARSTELQQLQEKLITLQSVYTHWEILLGTAPY